MSENSDGSSSINPDIKSQKPAEVSRRMFLRKAAAVGATVLLGAALPGEPSTAENKNMNVAQSMPEEASLITKASMSAEPPKLPSEDKEVNEKQGNKELEPFSPSLTVLDMAPANPEEGISQNEFIPIDAMLSQMVKGYVSKETLEEEFGKDFRSTEIWKMVVQKYPNALMSIFLKDAYKNHGSSVIHTLQEIWKHDGKKVETVGIMPLQKIFDTNSISQAPVDELGNKGNRLAFDPQKIISILKDDHSDVINCSFQVGDVDLMAIGKQKIVRVPPVDLPFRYEIQDTEDINKERVYLVDQAHTGYETENGIGYPVDGEGKRITPISAEEFRQLKKQKEMEARKQAKVEIVQADPPERIDINGAYAAEKAMENLPKLFSVCDAYPNKLFVFAAGNEGEDLREALKALGKKRPENLLLVAQWGGYKNAPYSNVYGADIYVNNEDIGVPNGSSFSTPVVSAIASELRAKGYSLEQTIQVLKAATQKKEFDIQDEEKPEVVALLDPSAFEQKAA